MGRQTDGVVRRRVLIVDDDALHSRALARDFKILGHEVRIATTAEEAISAAGAAAPDLVVLDVYLPHRSALELLRLWKQSTPDLPVVLVSGNPSLPFAVDCMREGAIGFCTKPVTVDTILAEVEQRRSLVPSPPPAPPVDASHRLCAASLQPKGVDRFFTMSQGLFCIAGFDGYFKLLNRAWEKTLGYTLDELCATPYLDLVHPEDREKASDEAVQMADGEAMFCFRNRYRCKNGSYKWLAWNATPCLSEQLIYACASDVTAAVAVEETLSADAARLRRLAARREDLLETSVAEKDLLIALSRFKDEMTGLIVHDLKNPLSVIIANYDFIMERLTAFPECVEALADSRNAGQRMMRLLANLLDVRRLEEHRLEVNLVPTDVSLLVAGIVDERRLMGQARRISIELDLPGQTVIEVDADLLTRTTENILDNAFRYTPEGGRIEVEVRDAGEHVETRIGNSGPAIPVEERTVVFEKHYQTSPHAAHMNLGLGLYFCRLATEAQGGRIWVEETKGLATVFAIQLPRRRPTESAGAATAP